MCHIFLNRRPLEFVIYGQKSRRLHVISLLLLLFFLFVCFFVYKLLCAPANTYTCCEVKGRVACTISGLVLSLSSKHNVRYLEHERCRRRVRHGVLWRKMSDVLVFILCLIDGLVLLILSVYIVSFGNQRAMQVYTYNGAFMCENHTQP